MLKHSYYLTYFLYYSGWKRIHIILHTTKRTEYTSVNITKTIARTFLLTLRILSDDIGSFFFLDISDIHALLPGFQGCT